MKNWKYGSYYVLSKNIYHDKVLGKVRLFYSTMNGNLILLSDKNAEKFLNNQKIADEKINADLKNAGMLLHKNDKEVDMLVARNNYAISKSSTLNFVIMPTSYCNMGCTYCGQSHEKGGIDSFMMDRIVSRIKTSINNAPKFSSAVKNVHLSWFGGEPMVGYKRIISINKTIIEEAEKHNFNFASALTTNASLLDLEKVRNLHLNLKINEMNFTIDGPRDIHDKRRILLNGEKNFDKTIALLKEIVNTQELKGLSILLRTNIDIENQDYIDEYLDFMYENQFNSPQLSYQLIGVYSWSNDVSKVKIEKKDFAKRETEWMIKMLNYKMPFSTLPRQGSDLVCIAVDPFAEVIDPYGKIFSCSEHPLVDRYKNDAIDFVSDWQSPRKEGFYDSFNDKVKDGKYPCSSCKFFGVCGGTCPKQWDEGNIPCPAFTYNVQDRLDIIAWSLGLTLE